MPAFAAALGAVARRYGRVSAVIAHSLGCTAAIYALSQREFEAERVVVISPSARLHAVRERFGEMAGYSPQVIDHMRQAFEKRFAFEWEASEPLRIALGLSVPGLIIHDADDRFIPSSEGTELADAWPDGRLVTTTNLGHHRILRDPEVIASAVEFVAESTPRSLIERRAS
jgi:pimeloyl-ACP methyl ester carboxylesterase